MNLDLVPYTIEWVCERQAKDILVPSDCENFLNVSVVLLVDECHWIYNESNLKICIGAAALSTRFLH